MRDIGWKSGNSIFIVYSYATRLHRKASLNNLSPHLDNKNSIWECFAIFPEFALFSETTKTIFG